MTRRLLAALVVLAIGAAAPAAEARKAPPRHAAAAKQQTVKQRAARKRALARHRAAVRRREAARRKALAEALAAVPLPATAPAVPLPAPEVTTPDPQPAAGLPPVVSAPPARTIGITQREFSLSLSRTTVGDGDVTVQVLNRGEDPHDLRIETLDGGLLWFFDELASLTSTAPTVVPMTAGTYRVFCTLTGHAALGMDTRLTVAAG